MKSILIALLLTMTATTFAADKKIVFIAGNPSHRSGDHEHRAGCLLLQACLTNVPGVVTTVHSNGWPKDLSAFTDAAAVVVYCDGGAGHPLLREERKQFFRSLMDRGVGLALLHYGVEPTKENGQAEFLDWIGGAFEIHWSVNPFWVADFKTLPNHPIARGVTPFQIEDEWYFNMRFRDGLKGVTPILSAVPPRSTTERPDGPHSGNPTMREMVARGDQQHVAWAYERPKGGRGFGFTGGHRHSNWGNEAFRKTVLNAILWVAQVEVPAAGVVSSVSPEQLEANLDDKRDRRPSGQ
jgi:type 1 glutamine amidotransferase